VYLKYKSQQGTIGSFDYELAPKYTLSEDKTGEFEITPEPNQTLLCEISSKESVYR
jgi:hypothetical protein